MTNKSILALVVSSSGPLQDGLLALMTTIPQIGAVLVAEDIESALKMVTNHQPALIILDISLPVMHDVINQIKEQCPHIHMIILVEDITQQKETLTSGADSVLLKGFHPQKLIEIVENHIDLEGSNSSIHTNQKGGTTNETA